MEETKVILVLKDMKGSKPFKQSSFVLLHCQIFPHCFKHKPFLFSYSHFGAENMPKSVQFALRLTNHCVFIYSKCSQLEDSCFSHFK